MWELNTFLTINIARSMKYKEVSYMELKVSWAILSKNVVDF